MKTNYINSFKLFFNSLLVVISLLSSVINLYGEEQREYSLSGIVIDKITREPVPYAAVSIWQTNRFAVTDTLGRFTIENVPVGAYRIQVDMLGYTQLISEQMMVSISANFIRLEIEEESRLLEGVTVRPKADPFRRLPESPLSQRSIGVAEIERNPGSNRDISRVVASLPGVATVNAGGYRNDLLVRGGGPSENRFFFDGIEIPTINHFSTQGASGGSSGIIDADFIREVNFYSGAFPVARGGGLSSVLDFRLKDGDPVENKYKFTVGAAEAGFSTSGHFTSKTNYLFSVRRSYLQLLFKAIGLPFLPSFIDTQFKIETRFDNKHELTFLGVAGLDDMSLNDDAGGKESNEYILAFLPVIQQEVFTLGTAYRYFYGRNSLNLYLSHSFLQNRNTKYRGNDQSSPDNLILLYRSVENETKFRLENLMRFSDFSLTAGFGADMPRYFNDTYQKIFIGEQREIEYTGNLNFFKYALFANLNYTSPQRRFFANFGLRADGNSFSREMSNPLNQFSPRVSLSYKVAGNMFLNASAGRYYQLPPLTAMGFRDREGQLLNKDLKYIGSNQVAVGFDYRGNDNVQLAVELFHKWNFNGMYSVNDSIPVEGKSTNYGVVGNEKIASVLDGRSYGAEFTFRWFYENKFNLISSLTLFRSIYRDPVRSWTPQPWDNRYLLTIAGGYIFPKNFVAGVKFRYAGGAPYTPLDEERSSLVSAWDASGRAYRDYSRFNSLYLANFTQLDIRVDKEFYFNKFALKLYLDLQNALNTRYRDADVVISTGRIINPEAPYNMQRYEMKRIELETGIILPTIGITIEF